MRTRLLIVLALVGIPVLVGVVALPTRPSASAQLASQVQQELYRQV